MSKHRSGLQKQVSAIFDGVPIPSESSDAEQKQSAGTLIMKRLRLEQSQSDSEKPVENKASSAARKPAPKSTTVAAVDSSDVTAGNVNKKSLTDLFSEIAEKIPWQKIYEQITNKLSSGKIGAVPTRQKVMVALIPVLFITLIFVLMSVFGGSTNKTNSALAADQLSVTADRVTSINWKTPEPYSCRRDPMQFGSVSQTNYDSGTIVVKGIVYSDDKPAAVIGTNIVHVGEKIYGATVLAIHKDSVEFEMNGKKWVQKVQR